MRTEKFYRFQMLAVVLMASLNSFAQTVVKINDINYMLHDENNEAAVYREGSNDVIKSKLDISGDVKIPESVTYKSVTYKVTSIGVDAFYGCTGMTSVTIPNTIVSIGANAFEGCSGLSSICIPASVENIGDIVLGKCSSLKSIVVDKDNKVYDSRNDCNALIETSTNILIAGCGSTVIPDGVERIKDNAFSGNNTLTSIVIPNSVSKIGVYAFANCENLMSVTLPENLKILEDGVFSGCTSLVSVSLPETLTTIRGYAFYCSGLKSIAIPAKVSYIGESVFQGCENLTSVTNMATVPQTIYYRTFTTFGDLIVPSGSEEAYRNAPIWKGFATLNGEPLATGIDELQVSNDKSPIYNLSGKRLDRTQKGVNIINGKKYILK